MWTSSQTRSAGRPEGHDAQFGTVTASGRNVSAYVDAEQRWLPVMAPGGYRWRPCVGDQVLVLKTGEQSEGACVIAGQDSGSDDLAPGEVELIAPGCRLKMTGAGAVEITGQITVNGVALEDLIRGTVASTLMPALQTEG